MRCLYCGKELALLKRLRGGGDFCSDAHKQSYQEEYNRLALSRLLQAQKKGQQANNSPAQNAASPPNSSVANSSVANSSVALEEPVLAGGAENDANGRAADVPAIEASVTEALTHAEPAAAIHSLEEEESSGGSFSDAETSLGAEPEPTEYAGFLFESPAVADLAEEAPYLESWLELSPGPAMSEWQAQNGAFSLSPADLLALDLRPTACFLEERAVAGDLAPQALASAQPEPALSPLANSRKIASANRLPAGSAIVLDIAPSPVASTAEQGFLEAIGPETTVLFDDSALLGLLPTSIDFPAEDSGVVLSEAPAPETSAPEASALETPAPEAPVNDDGPRASLEALSRLHQELVEQETTQAADAGPVEVVEAKAVEAEIVEAEVVEAEAAEVLHGADAVSAALTESPQAGPEVVDVTPEDSGPKFATELFEISIKTFPPAKAALIGGDAFPSNSAPLLPHLKLLPLRPKVALAPGYVPPAQSSAVSEAAPAPPAPVVRAQVPSKPAAGKPPARLTQPKQPSSPSAKLVRPVKTAEPHTPAAPKADANKPVVNAAPSEAAPVPEVAAKAAPAADQAKPAADQIKPAVDQTAPVAVQKKPAAEKAKPADTVNKDNAPNFDIAQPANASGFGSLKVKLGIAILILVIACVYFLGWGGGKPNKPASPAQAASADGSGPSIIMGEGGWVENWAGDPGGMHAGRQITIYRPSLKLSDYRLEFQASIDTKSVGWVFRAADPDNYYAMKLMTVSAGLSPKVALFKYLVANGKQTQVGRVPIDLTVQQDTLFDIRVDVRGPQFTTYIQGQQVDSWTDDQLKTGGAGFLNEREERGKVKSVSIRYLSGAANK
jgi:hypothetical protein